MFTSYIKIQHSIKRIETLLLLTCYLNEQVEILLKTIVVIRQTSCRFPYRKLKLLVEYLEAELGFLTTSNFKKCWCNFIWNLVVQSYSLIWGKVKRSLQVSEYNDKNFTSIICKQETKLSTDISFLPPKPPM